MKIRFIKPWTVQQGDGKGPKYKVGDVVDFNGKIAETYARKYIRRGLAVDTANDPKPAPPVESAPAAPELDVPTAQDETETAEQPSRRPRR